MPIQVIDQNDSIKVLNRVNFINDEGLKYFTVRDQNDYGFSVDYIPIEVSDWDKDQYEIHLLDNAYLDAENDVFEVYENSLEERIGWVFPITILESNDNDFRKHKNLNHYKFITYKLLLERDVNMSTIQIDSSPVKLSQLYPNSIICVLCKRTVKKIKHFSFKRYLLSLHKQQYLIWNSNIQIKRLYNRDSLIMEIRKRRKIVLHKAKFPIEYNEFIKSLFVENLLQSESYLVRFIFLYQILEHFMDLEFDIKFNNSLKEYQTGQLKKNDLKEIINTTSKERSLIKKVLTTYSISEDLRTEFSTYCDYLFSELGIRTPDSFSDKLYDLRNLVTHRLRDLTKRSNDLQNIIGVFELLMADLLINRPFRYIG